MKQYALTLALSLLGLTSVVDAQIYAPTETLQRRAAMAEQSAPPPGCGFDELREQMPPGPKQRQQQVERQLRQLTQDNPPHFRNDSTAVYTVPVVVHIVHENGAESITDEVVLQGIGHLNDAFANLGYYDQGSGAQVGIEFCLARQDPDGNLTNGITRTQSPLTVLDKDNEDQDLKDLVRWDPTCYINIWLVRSIIGNVAGYAYLPGAHGASFDGIVCEYPFLGSSPGNSSITVHELGHYFGLYHTFQGGCSNDDCTLDGDQVCDTPPDASTAAVPCDNPANTCATDVNSGFVSDQDDMNENYMDYGDRFCQHDFTQGQAERMVFFLTGIRSSLLDCSSCLDPCPVPISVDVQPNPLPVAVGDVAVVNLDEAFTQYYAWYLGDSLVSNSASLDLPVESLEAFSLVLEASNDNADCFAYDTLLVQPFCASTAVVNADVDTLQVTAGQQVSINGSVQNAQEVHWWLDGVQIGSGLPLNYAFQELGWQALILEGTRPYEDCNGRDTIWVQVNCPPSVSVELPGAYQLVQLNETVTFPSNAMNTEGISWTLDGMPAGNGEELTYTFDEFGVYDLVVTGESSVPACNVQDAMQVEVECGQQLFVAANETFLFAGDTVSFSGAGNGVQQYEWYINGSLASNDPFFDYSFEQGGVYEVYLIATFSFCEQRSQSIIVTVQNPCFYDTLDVAFEYSLPRDPINVLPSAEDDGYLLVFVAEVVKVDANYEPVWSRSYTGDVVFMGGATNTAEGGYYLTYFGAPDQLTKVMKINEAGDVLWTRGMAPPERFSYPATSELTSRGDGSVFLFERLSILDMTGITSPYSYFLMLSPLGQDLWSLEIPGFEVSDAHFTPDGGILLAGFSSDFSDALSLVKLSGNGLIEWSTALTPQGADLASLSASFIESYDDGHYLVAFNAQMSGELYGHGHLVKVSPQGEVVWGRRLYDEGLPQAGQLITGLDRALDGDFLVAISLSGIGLAQSESDIVRFTQEDELRWARKNPIQPHLIRFFRQAEEGEIAVFGGQPGIDNLLYLVDESGFSGSCVMEARQVSAPPRGFQQAFDIYTQESFLEYQTPPVPMEVANDITINTLCSVEGINGMDVETSLVGAALCGDSITISTQVCNLGNLPVPLDLPLAVYNQNPLSATQGLVDTLRLATVVEPDSCALFSFTLPDGFPEDMLYLMFNDDGTAALPFNFLEDFPRSAAEECNYFNNLDSLSLEGLPVPEIPVVELGPDTVLCAGDSLLLRAPDGLGSYLWPDGSGGTAFWAEGPGTYIFSGQASCGAALSDTLRIGPPPSVSLDLGPDLSGCQNEIFDLNAGSGFAFYQWQDGSFDSLYTAWEAGTYWVAATDYCGNVFRDTVTITLDPAYNIELGEPVTICPGDSVEIALQSSHADYQWFPDTGLSCDTCATVSLRPGQTTRYTLTAQDADCFSSDTLTVNVLPAYNLSSTVGICPGDTAIVFGQPVVSEGSFTQSFTTLQGCDSIVQVNVVALQPVATSEELLLCAGESAVIFGDTLTAGGTYVQTFTGQNGCDSTHTVDLSIVDTIRNLVQLSLCEGETITLFGQEVSQGGLYEQTFQSVAGCDSTQQYLVTLTQAIETSEDVSICAGETVQLWGQSLQASGVYDSTFVAASGCDSTHVVTLSVLDTAFTQQERAVCAGDTAIVFGNAVAAAGDYTNTYTGATGCDSTHLIRLSVLDTFYQLQTQPLCAGDTLDWLGQAITAAGRYELPLITAAGCDSTLALNAILLQPAYTEDSIQICAGETIELFGQQVFESGVYEGYFTAANGCDSTHRVTLSVQDSIQTTEERIICAGESTLVFGESQNQAGNYSQAFSSQSGCDSVHTVALTVLDTTSSYQLLSLCQGDSLPVFGAFVQSAGLYSQLYQNSEGCDSTAYIEVSLLDTVRNTSLASICEGDSLLLFGQYEREAGLYTEVLTGSNGCDSVEAVELQLLPVSSSFLSLRQCEGDSSLIFGNYEQQAGTYVQTYTNQFGCDSVATVELTVDPAPELALESAPSCAGQSTGSIAVSASGAAPPYVFDWGHTAVTASELDGLATGTYFLTVTDAQGCSAIIEAELAEAPLPEYSIQVQGQSCDDSFDGQITVAGEDGLLYSLNGGAFTDSGLFTDLAAGQYTLELQSAAGCLVEDEVTVTAPPELSVSLPPLISIELGDSVLLQPSGQMELFSAFSWSPGTALSCTDCPAPVARPLEDQQYALTAIDSNGCTATAEILVEVDTERSVYIPNVFSPNDDGRNDRFRPLSDRPYEVLVFRVFDRWGSVLYEEVRRPLDQLQGWDGQSRGEALKAGVYVYQLKLRYANGREEGISGEVVLLR